MTELRYKYRVISGVSLEDFEERVANHLSNGWALTGGLVVSDRFYQAVVYTPPDSEGGLKNDAPLPTSEYAYAH